MRCDGTPRDDLDGGAMSGACSSCGAPIVWAITEAGKRVPLDAKPIRIAIVARDNDGAEILDNGARVIARGENGYVSHFATCPNAAAHRKPRATK